MAADLMTSKEQIKEYI